jgi:hypothetical protein
MSWLITGSPLLYPIKVTRALVLTAELLLLTFIPAINLLAQSQPEERPKLKNFGSSLDRLKWDPNLNEAVEEKPEIRKANAGANGDDDVIKVETSLVICSVAVVDQHGKVVPNLTKDDFILTENGHPQNVYHFSLGNNLDVPRTIVLLIVQAQSVPLSKKRRSGQGSVDKLGPKDLMACDRRCKATGRLFSDKKRIEESSGLSL